MRVELETDQLILKSQVSVTLSAPVKVQIGSNQALLAIRIDPTGTMTLLLLGEEEGSVGQARIEVVAEV